MLYQPRSGRHHSEKAQLPHSQPGSAPTPRSAISFFRRAVYQVSSETAIAPPRTPPPRRGARTPSRGILSPLVWLAFRHPRDLFRASSATTDPDERVFPRRGAPERLTNTLVSRTPVCS